MGTAEAVGPGGTLTGSIRIEARGADECRVEIDFAPGERYLAISKGKRAEVHAASDWRAPAGLVGWRHGCLLLPRAATPAQFGFKAAGRAYQVTYSQFQSGPDGNYPAHIEIRDGGGKLVLRVQLASIAMSSQLPDGDFALGAAGGAK